MELLMSLFLLVSLAAFLFGYVWQNLDNNQLPVAYHQSAFVSGGLLALAWPLLAALYITSFIRSRF